MTVSRKDASQKFYRARINRVIGHICKNPAEELSLSRLAAVANFSEFHFHRISTHLSRAFRHVYKADRLRGRVESL